MKLRGIIFDKMAINLFCQPGTVIGGILS